MHVKEINMEFIKNREKLTKKTGTLALKFLLGYKNQIIMEWNL